VEMARDPFTDSADTMLDVISPIWDSDTGEGQPLDFQ